MSDAKKVPGRGRWVEVPVLCGNLNTFLNTFLHPSLFGMSQRNQQKHGAQDVLWGDAGDTVELRGKDETKQREDIQKCGRWHCLQGGQGTDCEEATCAQLQQLSGSRPRAWEEPVLSEHSDYCCSPQSMEEGATPGRRTTGLSQHLTKWRGCLQQVARQDSCVG